MFLNEYGYEYETLKLGFHEREMWIRSAAELEWLLKLSVLLLILIFCTAIAREYFI